MSDEPDVRIVGGSLVGLSTALFLRLHGISCLAVERRDRRAPPGISLARGQQFEAEQLALSTQCGFASAGPGNAISEDAQEKKLHLIAEVAARAWQATQTA